MFRAEIVGIVFFAVRVLGDEFDHLFEDKPNLNLNQFEINCKRLSLILILTEILNLILAQSFNLIVAGSFHFLVTGSFNRILIEIFNLILAYSVFLCGINFAMIMY
jgi:hypothetical protein